ncbi:hypothetical protein [Rhodococcus oryzae]|uniref:hypothetical protein n=1 Tax=Rhodococcus oryzae TaxID=2571143 RepID=UPI003789E301
MRDVASHRRFVAGAVASVAVLALPLGSSAEAQADAPPMLTPATMVFQVPVTFVSACSTVGFSCWVPHQLVAVTPTATTGAPGVVTFAAGPPTTASITTLDCIDVSVNWRNLTTGAAGTTVLRAIQRADFSASIAPDEWCRYAPATVVAGSGTVASIADVSARVFPHGSGTWPQVPVSPGIGVFQLP